MTMTDTDIGTARRWIAEFQRAIDAGAIRDDQLRQSVALMMRMMGDIEQYRDQDRAARALVAQVRDDIRALKEYLSMLDAHNDRMRMRDEAAARMAAAADVLVAADAVTTERQLILHAREGEATPLERALNELDVSVRIWESLPAGDDSITVASGEDDRS